MKDKLKKFKDFASSLLPHEITYINTLQNFVDPENISILSIISFNVHNPNNQKEFDLTIDKRKYSRLMKWIESKLQKMDVDYFYFKICELNNKIITDSISSEEELELLNVIKHYKNHYFFSHFYELVRNFSDYLLIRHRHNFYSIVYSFLEKHKHKYIKASEIAQKLQRVTQDIIKKYSESEIEPLSWEKWLLEIFNNSEIDGRNRFLAFVRLTYLYYTYKEFTKLYDLYKRVENLFESGEFYSKRLLVNYYANIAMINYKLNNLDKAETYGYLSLKFKNNEYLHYLNTLCAILLRNKKTEDTLKLIRANFGELKQTNSLYNKVGFVSFYLKSLNKLNKFIEAEYYADNFIELNKKDLFKDRWHLLFSVYIYSLLHQEKYDKIIKQCKKFNLVDKELSFINSRGFYPIIHWYYIISLFKEVKISEANAINELHKSSLKLINNNRFDKLDKLIKDTKNFCPVIINRIENKTITA